MKRNIKIHFVVSDKGEFCAMYYENREKKDQTDVGTMAGGFDGLNVQWGTVEVEIDTKEIFKATALTGTPVLEENSNG